MDYFGNNDYRDYLLEHRQKCYELFHYGTPMHSGRYPWGSGENPYHHGASSPFGKKKEPKNKLVEKAKKGKKFSRKEGMKLYESLANEIKLPEELITANDRKDINSREKSDIYYKGIKDVEKQIRDKYGDFTVKEVYKDKGKKKTVEWDMNFVAGLSTDIAVWDERNKRALIKAIGEANNGHSAESHAEIQRLMNELGWDSIEIKYSGDGRTPVDIEPSKKRK